MLPFLLILLAATTDAAVFVAIGSALATLSVGAMVRIVQLFLRAQKDFVRIQQDRDESWQAALAEHRRSTELFLGNHMGEVSKALQNTSLTLDRLVSEVRAK